MAALLHVRVMVQEVWDEVRLELPASTPIVSLKAIALEKTGVTMPPDAFQAKFRGALLTDEDRSLGDVGMVTNSTVILVPRRRQPVR
jgi:hypothetical protein